MEAEGAALARGDSDEVARLAGLKPDAARKVESASALRRRSVAADVGLVAALKPLALRIHDLARRNELLLNMKLQQVGAALQLLLGHGPAPIALYAADGRPQRPVVGNSIGGKV